MSDAPTSPAATCPSCKRPWSEHTKGLPGFVPICPPRPASSAIGPEFICDHSESLTELCDTCLARRYHAALEQIAGLDTIVWDRDGTIKQQAEAGRIAREALA